VLVLKVKRAGSEGQDRGGEIPKESKITRVKHSLGQNFRRKGPKVIPKEASRGLPEKTDITRLKGKKEGTRSRRLRQRPKEER